MLLSGLFPTGCTTGLCSFIGTIDPVTQIAALPLSVFVLRYIQYKDPRVVTVTAYLSFLEMLCVRIVIIPV